MGFGCLGFVICWRLILIVLDSVVWLLGGFLGVVFVGFICCRLYGMYSG